MGESRKEKDPYQNRGRAEGFIFISESSSASPMVTELGRWLGVPRYIKDKDAHSNRGRCRDLARCKQPPTPSRQFWR
jgi:hypothetical protein